MNYNNYYVNHCFYNFDYKDYYFIWIIFIQECYEYYKKTGDLLDIRSYYHLIYDFSSKSNIKDNNIVIDVLNNNDIKFNDMNKILQSIINDEILIDKKHVITAVEEDIVVVEPVITAVETTVETTVETVVESVVVEPNVVEPFVETLLNVVSNEN